MGTGVTEVTVVAQQRESVSPAYVQKFLSGMDYPASKQEIIDHAKKNNADQDVISILQQIPDQQYNSAADVSSGIGQVQ